MLHRMTAGLLIWLVLLGAAAPALACAMPERDCCPPESTSPCEDGDFGKGSRSAAECAGLSALTSVATDPVRIRDALEGFASPHFAITAAPFAALEAARGPPLFTPLPRPEVRSDAALTWLRTGRLRL